MPDLTLPPPAPTPPPATLPFQYTLDPITLAAYVGFLAFAIYLIIKLSLKEYDELIREYYEEGKWRAKY